MEEKENHQGEGGGRPTKYRDAYCDILVNFFDQEVYEEIKTDKLKNGVKVGTDVKRFPRKLPTLVGFAKEIGIGYSTLKDWCNENHPSYQGKFSATVTRVKDLQRDFLIQSGLLGLFNPQAFKFVAVNITDMVDKRDVGIEPGQEAKKFMDWLASRDNCKQ